MLRKTHGSAASTTRARALRKAGLTAVAGSVFAATIVMPPTHAATVSSGFPEGNPYTAAFHGASCTIGVVGDIAGSAAEVARAQAVKAMMDANGVGHFLLPGDLAYYDGTAAEFDAYFAPVFGLGDPAKNRPIPGNHEWNTPGATGYYDHAFPGIPQNYAYDACGWRVVSVDAESPAQVTAAAAFIRSEDAKRPDQPTAIQWHRPRFSSNNKHGSDVNRQALWQAAVDTRAALVLNGHEHAYERFAPRDAAGQPAADGVTQFVIGTGGRLLTAGFTPLPGSQSRLDTYYGAGIFELFDDGRWSMEFRDSSAPAGIVRDSASGVSPTLESGTPPTPAPSPLPTTSTRTYAPVADATVVSASPTRNYGSATSLEVDSSPVEQSLMKFTVEGTSGHTVTSAKLRLYVTNAAPSGGSFFRTADTGWSESTVSWSTAPAADTTPFATHGPVASGTWIEVDAAPLVDGDGTYSIRTTGTTSDGAGYSSKEAALNQPQLVLSLESDAPQADLTPPTPVTDLSAVPVSTSQIDLDWTDAVDDTAVTGYRVHRDGVDSGTTITGSTFSDTGLTASTTYSYTVTALDAAGNASGASNVVSTTTHAAPPPPVTLTLLPVADASIKKNNATTVYGRATGLDADGSPVEQFLMRFKVTGSEGRTVTSAKLRLYVTDASPAGGDLFPVAGNTWSETSVTFRNAPAAGTTRLATLGAVTVGSWAEVELGGHITGDGVYSLRVTSTSADGATYSSKEAATNKPHLVVTLR